MRYCMVSATPVSVRPPSAFCTSHIRSRLHIHRSSSSKGRARGNVPLPKALQTLVATGQPRSDARGAGLRQHS